MRNLAKDLVAKREVFEPPLVYPDGGKYVVADGNRRTTCLKLLAKPRRAPTVELQQFFADLRKQWTTKFPDKIECRVESDRDRVDDILFRRHTGVQGGIGQSNWNDRMKNNFVIRTSKSSGLNVADEIEKRLKAAHLLPAVSRDVQCSKQLCRLNRWACGYEHGNSRVPLSANAARRLRVTDSVFMRL